MSHKTDSRRDLSKFISSISRTRLRNKDADYMLQFLKKDISWERVVRLAEAEGVAGLLYYHLNNLDCLGFLPEVAVHYLEAFYQRTTRNTLAIVSKVAELSVMFKHARIPVIALQGLSIIKLYKHPGMRTMEDADLMVKASHKEKIKKLLQDSGFLPVPTYPDYFSKNGFLIDIHTHLLNLDRIRSRRYLFPEDLSAMWDNAVSLFDKEHGLLCLDAYDNFIALSAHALKHSYTRLIWLVDLHECLLFWSENSDAWRKLVERARFWQQEKVVLYALILIEKIFQTDIPQRVKLDLGIRQLSIMEKYLLDLKIKGFSSTELCIALWLCNIKGIVNKLRFMQETIFPREEVMLQISLRSSSRVAISDYANRTLDTIELVGKNLGMVLRLSFKGKSNE